MKVAFVTPELVSLIRRTNLARVAEALAGALRGAGADVRVFLPWTKDVRIEALDSVDQVGQVSVPDGRGSCSFGILEGRLGDLPLYLLDQEKLFRGRHPYGDSNGPYPDNWRRYALFSRAVLEAFPEVRFSPDVIHCLDWTSGLIPVYRELEYIGRDDHPAARAGTFFGIHNLAMQGTFEREILPHIGLPHEYFRSVGGVELGGKVNFLKAGAECATVLGTHSPGHAEKIQECDRGHGLEETFRRRKKELVGIANGIDYHAWDPSSDPILTSTFSAGEKQAGGKRKCKAHLQEIFKLDSAPRTPLVCSIGRWDADSGFDLLAEILTSTLERGVQLVLMGMGEPDIHQRLKTIETTFVGSCKIVEGYHTRSAHMIMGGADLLLLPSHYQPSNSLFAIGMRYGVSPVIYEQGGLENTVVDARNDEEGTGFHFGPYTSEGLGEGLEAALKGYRAATKWKKLVQRCMEQDFSWEATASEYLKAYRRVTRRTRSRRSG